LTFVRLQLIDGFIPSIPKKPLVEPLYSVLGVEKPSGLSSCEEANGRNPEQGETKKDSQVPWLVLRVALLFPSLM